jgi:hypothetical protein
MTEIIKTVKRVVATLFIFSLTINSLEASFILHNEGILTDKTAQKIEIIGTEVKRKLGISLYVSAKKNLGKKHITEYGAEMSSLIDGPFALFTFAQYEKKIDIISSPNVGKLFDKDEVLNDYTIPIIAYVDKNSENSKYNAALLNGYSELAEQVASSKGVSLETAIGNESSNIVEILRVVIYGFLFIMGIFYLYKSFFGRKA